MGTPAARGNVVVEILSLAVELVVRAGRSVQWPVFVVEGDDVLIGRDITHFKHRFEEVDLRGGTYDLFDSTGKRLSLDWSDRGAFGPGAYEIGAESRGNEREYLVGVLRKFLKNRVSADASLDELVSAMLVVDRG